MFVCCDSGGTLITVTGSDMDVAQEPGLNILVDVERVVPVRRGGQEKNLLEITAVSVCQCSSDTAYIRGDRRGDGDGVDRHYDLL